MLFLLSLSVCMYVMYVCMLCMCVCVSREWWRQTLWTTVRSPWPGQSTPHAVPCAPYSDPRCRVTTTPTCTPPPFPPHTHLSHLVRLAAGNPHFSSPPLQVCFTNQLWQPGLSPGCTHRLPLSCIHRLHTYTHAHTHLRRQHPTALLACCFFRSSVLYHLHLTHTPVHTQTLASFHTKAHLNTHKHFLVHRPSLCQTSRHTCVNMSSDRHGRQ